MISGISSDDIVGVVADVVIVVELGMVVVRMVDITVVVEGVVIVVSVVIAGMVVVVVVGAKLVRKVISLPDTVEAPTAFTRK